MAFPLSLTGKKNFSVDITLCSSGKYPYTHRKNWNFLGVGISVRPKNLKKCRKLKKDFLRGGESSVGDVWKCLELHIWKTHWFYIANHPRHYQSLWCRYVSMNFPWHHEFCFLFVDLLLVQFWLHQLLPTSILTLWTEMRSNHYDTSRTCGAVAFWLTCWTPVRQTLPGTLRWARKRLSPYSTSLHPGV